MVCGDAGLAIAFNGEIYNYRELRASLEKKGYRFRSHSDTEVLLRMYEDAGPDMVHKLRGMYAFSIWDEKKGGLFLARDPFGIKPLYYADDGKSFRAASQVRALLAGSAVSTAAEPAGHVGFFLWGHVPEPYTLYKGIRSLPAGSTMWVDLSGRKRIDNFCSIGNELAKAASNTVRLERREMLEKLHQALFESVRYHLVADVPVGVFLSSGLDSTTLAAMVAEVAPKSLNTVTLGFEEYRGTEYDETPLAGLVGGQYGAAHNTVWIGKSDFEAERGRLIEAMDQPSIDGVNSYFVSLAAARIGLKVAISGLGGDELFGGYASFRQIPGLVSRMGFVSSVPLLGRVFRVMSAPLMKHYTSPKYAGLIEYGGNFGGAYLLRRSMLMPWELPEVLDGEMVREGWRELQTLVRLDDSIRGICNAHHKISALEMEWYMRNQLLRDTDWASMAHSLEVRVPLVDLELLRTVAAISNQDDYPTKKDMAGSPKKPLSAEVLNRRKTGFSIPVREWLLDGEEQSNADRGLRGWAKYVYKAMATGR
jgi:asparagine synthase (glutamine-hydrolysing)